MTRNICFDAMQLSLTIDGSRLEIDDAPATLAEIVRGFCGDNIVPTPCRAATCGACTVLSNGAPVLSCITQASLCEQAQVVTAASLAQDSRLAPLRSLFGDPLVQACGICASGLLASAKALLDANPRPTREDARHALAGNVCLCVGYGAILDAVTGHRAGTPLALLPSAQLEPLPLREEIATAVAQERRIVDQKADPLGLIRAMLPSRAVIALGEAADTFGWSWQSSPTHAGRQRAGSWASLQGAAGRGAIVFVALEVDSETELVSLRRVVTFLVGTGSNSDAIVESGVMRGIFLALRPVADAVEQLFPDGFPTAIDWLKIISFTSTDEYAAPDFGIRHEVCLATVRAIAGAIYHATGAFPDHVPHTPRWAEQSDLDNASNIS